MAGIQDRFSRTNELLFLAREKTKSLQTGVAIETKVRNQLGGQQDRLLEANTVAYFDQSITDYKKSNKGTGKT